MAIGRNGAAVRQLTTLFNVGVTGDLTDGQLLERFATRRGEAAELAFAALVERHGPLVLRVCRSVLRDEHDAQDAFQATFLVLATRAESLWVRDSLAPWLHAVAYRVALCARGVGRPLAEARASRARPEEAVGRSSSGEDRGPRRGGPRGDRAGCRSITASRSCSATWRAARTTRRPGTSAGRSARSRAGRLGDASGSGPG